jgi:hypothetical protein
LRKRTGGSRGHSAGGSIRRACAGRVWPSQRLQPRVVRLAFHLHPVGLGFLVARIGEPVRQPAVVGQQQQAFRIEIQPPRRIHVRRQAEAG